MSRVIRDMEVIKLQMKVLQEAQETSLAAHGAVCPDRSHDVDICASPTHFTGTPPTPVANTPQGDLLNSIICDIRHEARICSIIILTLFYNNTAAYSG